MVTLVCLFSLILGKNYSYVRIDGFIIKEKMAVTHCVTSIINLAAGKK